MRWAFAFVAALGLCACSTVEPQHNGRSGLFDYFKKLEPANASGGSHAARVREEEASDDGDRGPAAVEADSSSESEGSGPVGQGKIDGLRWPLNHVQVTSGFGKRGSEFHEGVDLHAPTGTSVFAAQTGRIIYAGSKIHGYGKLIVIRHEGGISTVYAHNSKILVKYGDRVKKGQKIAISGKSGRVSGPHLHFEVRKGVAALDPVRVMPAVGLKASL